MMKTTLALIATAVLAGSSAFAGDHNCANMSAADYKAHCDKVLTKLNLTPEQRSKLETAQQECMKAGCTKESIDKFMQTAKGVLSAEQYAQLEKECCPRSSTAGTKS
jgi:Spy/CpxP family protein refolding chaperone